jgi:hypothetical protein
MVILAIIRNAPDIVTTILDGTRTPDLTGRKLMQHDIPMAWTSQRKMFGFGEQPGYLKANIGGCTRK